MFGAHMGKAIYTARQQQAKAADHETQESLVNTSSSNELLDKVPNEENTFVKEQQEKKIEKPKRMNM